MVKRFLPFFIVLVFIFVLTIPSLAADVVQTEGDMFGFSYDSSKIYFLDKNLSGEYISVNDQIIDVTNLYFYIPCSYAAEAIDFYYNLIMTADNFYQSACDYGQVYNNQYYIQGSLGLPYYTWLGSNTIDGSAARVVSNHCRFRDLPFDTYDSWRYIRLTVSARNTSTPLKLVNWLARSISNSSYTLSATQGDHVGTVTSGSLTSSGYYITGNLKTKYYNGSSVATNTGTLSSNVNGTGGYLWVPSHTITATASSPLKMNISGGNISGTLIPSDSSFIDRTYVNTVSLSATRSYNDQQMIDAINDASDRNHDDLGRIEDQMQEVVDHMQGLEQQGNEINGTTSQSTINNASSVVSTGTSSLADTADYVSSGVTSGSSESQGYINFLSYGVEEMMDFGSGPLGYWLWGIIFIPIAFFIFRRISE